MDFGIARAVSDSSTTVAQTTAILGTASYFSPEQAKGETVDARTDLYSTGVVLFEMLTGRPPFRGDTPVAVAYQHVSETPVKPSVDQPQGLAGARRRRAARAREGPRSSGTRPRPSSAPTSRPRHPGKRARCIASPTRRRMLFGAPPSSLSSSELALRQLAEDETMTRTQRRPPAIWIWAGIIGVVVIVDRRHVLGVQPAAHRRPALERPRGPRRSPAPATRRPCSSCRSSGSPATRIDETSDTVPAGQVIRTDPGRRRDRRHRTRPSPCTCRPAESPSPCPTCATSRSTRRRPTSRRPASTPGTETRENSPIGARPTRCSARRPRPAARPRPGATVDFVVSSGHGDAHRPHGPDAVTRHPSYLSAENLQLTPVPKPDPACKSQPGSPVTQQSLPPGDVPQKSEVELTYCAG